MASVECSECSYQFDPEENDNCPQCGTESPKDVGDQPQADTTKAVVARKILTVKAKSLLAAWHPGRPARVSDHEILVLEKRSGTWYREADAGAVIQRWLRKYADTMILREVEAGVDGRSIRRWKTVYDYPSHLIMEMMGKHAVDVLPVNRVIEAERLNESGHFLGADNGVIDLRDGTLLPPKEAAIRYITARVRGYRRVGFNQRPQPTQDIVNRLFNHVDNEKRGYLLDSLAFALRGQPSGTFLMLVGDGNAGKTTLLRALSAAVGPEYSAYVAPDALQQASFNKGGGGPAEHLYPFADPNRFALLDEIEGGVHRKLATAIVKIVTGDSMLSIRRLHGHTEQRRPTATIIGACNKESIPRFDLSDSGMMRRYREVPYPEVPAQDRSAGFTEQVKRPDVAHALLDLLIDRGVALGDVAEPPKPPKVIVEATEARRLKDGGEVVQFAACIQPDPNGFAPIAHVWAAWCEWHDQAPSTKASDKVGGFTQRSLVATLPKYIRGMDTDIYTVRSAGRINRTRGWRGWKIVNQNDMLLHYESEPEPQESPQESTPEPDNNVHQSDAQNPLVDAVDGIAGNFTTRINARESLGQKRPLRPRDENTGSFFDFGENGLKCNVCFALNEKSAIQCAECGAQNE